MNLRQLVNKILLNSGYDEGVSPEAKITNISFNKEEDVVIIEFKDTTFIINPHYTTITQKEKVVNDTTGHAPECKGCENCIDTEKSNPPRREDKQTDHVASNDSNNNTIGTANVPDPNADILKEDHLSEIQIDSEKESEKVLEELLADTPSVGESALADSLSEDETRPLEPLITPDSEAKQTTTDAGTTADGPESVANNVTTN